MVQNECDAVETARSVSKTLTDDLVLSQDRLQNMTSVMKLKGNEY